MAANIYNMIYAVKKPSPIFTWLGVFDIPKKGAIEIKHVTLTRIRRKYSRSAYENEILSIPDPVP